MFTNDDELTLQKVCQKMSKLFFSGGKMYINIYINDICLYFIIFMRKKKYIYIYVYIYIYIFVFLHAVFCC